MTKAKQQKIETLVKRIEDMLKVADENISKLAKLTGSVSIESIISDNMYEELGCLKRIRKLIDKFLWEEK